MATGEEYLDNLLKALMESEESPAHQEETDSGDQNIEFPVEETMQEMPMEEMAELPIEETMQEMPIEEMAELPVEEIMREMPIEEAAEEKREEEKDDLAAMKALLEKDDPNNAIDEEDMLALLESIGTNPQEEKADSDDVFDFLANESPGEDHSMEPEEEAAKEKKSGKKQPKERKKKRHFLFGKKKHDRSEEIEEESAEATAEEASWAETPEDFEAFQQEVDFIIGEAGTEADEKDNEGNEGNEGEEINQVETKVKKPGLFSRLITLLTEEQEELDADSDTENGENTEGAELTENETSGKKEKKKKKEDKKKKKGKNKKAGKDEEDKSDAGETAGEGEEDPKKKAKREKKEKKKQEKEQRKLEKPVKVLSRKGFFVLVAACATIIAGVLALSTFLPDYADKKNAREAFYVGNYETVYELLYDKRLGASDQLILNRVSTVLRMERKVQSYHNNIAMNREVEAIDALLRGIVCYQEMPEADEYGVRNEVDAIYQEICTLLNENYGISAEEAAEINSYDDETYTRRLYSIVNGTEFVKPGEEVIEETLPPQDILIDEEEMISYE